MTYSTPLDRKKGKFKHCKKKISHKIDIVYLTVGATRIY